MTMESKKRSNPTGPGPEVVERTRVAKEQVAQRFCSCTVQDTMRVVLGQMNAGAARGIINSANYSEIRAKQKAVSVAVQT